MGHVEFLGPPGAGKSAIYSRVISAGDVYGGTEDGAVRRVFLERARPVERLVYRLTPSHISRFFDDAFLEYRFGHRALAAFLRDHPDFVRTMSDTMDAVSHEPEIVFLKCLVSAERYQLGIDTVRDGERLCLDESFAQRAFAVLWRGPDDSFSLGRYFGGVPTPDVVVFVDAPPEVCLRRQRERGRVEVAKDWETGDPEAIQERTRELSLRVRDHLAGDAAVITVENTGSIDRVADQIRAEISQLP